MAESATTLVDLMGRRVSADPETPYFHLYDETVTYGDLWRESARYAAGLRKAGVDRGDKVCLIYPTCKEFFFTFFGALRLGAVPVPLYPTLGVEATANIFRDSEAEVVATIGWFRKGVEESQAGVSTMRHVLEPQDLEADAPVPAFPAASDSDTAFIQYTSGSTGSPRGVVLSHANVTQTVAFMAEAAQLTRDDVVVSWLPLYHDMGLIGCAFTPPSIGSPLWLLPPDLKNPRTFDPSGLPVHQDGETIVKERFYLDKANPDILYDQITTIDHALTRPWTVLKTMRREKKPIWVESICSEGNVHVTIGAEQYMIGGDGLLMPFRKGQPAPDLRHFNELKK